MTVDWGLLKPVLTAMTLPPVPWLALILAGAWRGRAGGRCGVALVCVGVLGIWLGACQGSAIWLQNHVLRPGPALEVQRWRAAQPLRAGQGHVPPPAAVMVLGSGRDAMAPEYGMADLSAPSAERLRYGVWLSRQTGLPLGFSGGVGWAQQAHDAVGGAAATSEAGVAARLAREMYGWPLTWVESQSADTRANAARTVAMLARQGVREIVLVTHAFHMPRAHRAFEEAAAVEARASGLPAIRVVRAPIAFWGAGERPWLDWLPSSQGMHNVYVALRECAGLLAGA